jgi:hypothetical protein
MRSVADKHFLARFVCASGSKSEEFVVEGYHAIALGCVVEKICHGLKRHVILLW